MFVLRPWILSFFIFRKERGTMKRNRPSDDTDKHPGETMGDKKEEIIVERSSLRISTGVTIKCFAYSICGAADPVDGVMCNFSKRGCYIETSCAFEAGTILLVRVEKYGCAPSSATDTKWPRSICLAEIKWRRRLTDENAIRFGMGLRYLE